MHYNNLVVKVCLKVQVGGHTHTCTTVSLLYIHEKKSGKIFFIREKSGNYQGISFLDFCGHPVIISLSIRPRITHFLLINKQCIQMSKRRFSQSQAQMPIHSAKNHSIHRW